MTRLLSVDLRHDTPAPDASPNLGDLNRLWEIPNSDLNTGSRLDSLWGDVRVQVRDDRERPVGLTDYFQTVPFTIVSAAFVRVLNAFGGRFEALPLIIEYRRRRLFNEYFALNVLTVLDDAVDRERSIFKSFDSGPLEEVEHLELKDGILSSVPIAYLKEIGSYAVSDELATSISSSGLRGVAVVSPKVFRI